MHSPATVLGIYKRSEHERHALLFETIIKRSTTDVAIGPLEYCGHGLTMRTTSGIIIPVLCHADPAIPPALLEREYRGRKRRECELEGKRKDQMAPKVKKARVHEVEKLLAQRKDPRKYILPEQSDTVQADVGGSVGGLGPKKSRLSADKYINRQLSLPGEGRALRHKHEAAGVITVAATPIVSSALT
ncbi:hypothetical protein PAXINDRAFT_20081 [Paxillus involutus ATCC 200175]|uniref:Uncharacterized protein n=1 Tax=Paxillus involutus ATCC 200175 TaxID=664439 RepID=A0A0C9SMT2_PAXIN|nr:hypothetical protein PAXINDRAFT_20081 [Paxillus involutus ATCC 200175]